MKAFFISLKAGSKVLFSGKAGIEKNKNKFQDFFRPIIIHCS
jgi:hypothetical protein